MWVRLILEVEIPAIIDLELRLEVKVEAAVVVAVDVALDVVVIPADTAEAGDLDAVELALDALAQAAQLLLLAARLILELAVLVAELLDLFLQITLLLLERSDAAVDVLAWSVGAAKAVPVRLMVSPSRSAVVFF